MLKDVAGQDIVEGAFIAYTTKTEAPGLQFGYVETLEVKVDERTDYQGRTRTYTNYKMKVRQAKADGTKMNKISVTWDDVLEKRVLEDTGRPSTTWLSGYGAESKRFLVTRPV